jgi:hypothetical protein
MTGKEAEWRQAEADDRSFTPSSPASELYPQKTELKAPERKASTIPPILGQKEIQKHTLGGIPRWSPTLVLVARFSAYVWQSGRDAQFSLTYGRMYKSFPSTAFVRETIA